MVSLSFLLALITFDRVLTCTKQLSDSLQSSSIDLSQASELALATKSLLTEYCSDSYWQKVYDQTTRVAELYDITVEFPTRRRWRLPAQFNDSIVSEPIGLTVNQQHSAKEDYKTQFFLSSARSRATRAKQQIWNPEHHYSERSFCLLSNSTGDLIPGSLGHTLLSSLSSNLFDAQSSIRTLSVIRNYT